MDLEEGRLQIFGSQESVVRMNVGGVDLHHVSEHPFLELKYLDCSYLEGQRKLAEECY